MTEILDGIGEGMKEWRNVQFIVRKAFNTVFHELRGIRTELSRSEALAARMTMVETKLTRLTNALEQRERKETQSKVLYDLMKKQGTAKELEASGFLFAADATQNGAAAPPPAPCSFAGVPSEVLARNAVNAALPTVKFTCEGASLRTTKGNIEWTDRTVISGDGRGISWTPSAAHYIRTALEGVYEINVGVFSPSAPRVALLVDNDEVLVSRTCRSYVTTKSVLAGRGGCHDTGAAAHNHYNKCSRQCLTGQTIHDLIWLPAGAKVSIHLDADAAYSAPRVKDALCILRFVQ